MQNTILRLVKDDCAALRRFSGTSDEDFYSYLAVICRSVVRDHQRRHLASKRPRFDRRTSEGSPEWEKAHDALAVESNGDADRGILVQQIRQLSERLILRNSGESAARDLLVFRMYYDHGLSTRQIAECDGVGLSKAGVEKLLDRLKERVRSAADSGYGKAATS